MNESYPENYIFLKDGKLVRDLIPQVIERNDGKKPRIRILKHDQLIEALRHKLGEELRELLDAKNKEEFTHEAADLLEVMYALAKEQGIMPDDIDSARKQKLLDRGGFEKGIFLVKNRE